jgi:hypothetical protein
MRKYLFILSVLFSIVISSCVNLEHVSKYSSNALSGIRKFNDVDWTFEKSCLETCLLTDIKNVKIPAKCNCDNFAKADNATSAITAVLSGYFSALADLSNEKVGNYKFDDLSSALKEGNFGPVNLKKEHVDAGNNIAIKLSKLFTDGVKAKKLKGFISDSDKDINVLLTQLQFIMSNNLKGTLNTKKSRHKILLDLMLNDDKASLYEKRSAILNYTTELKSIDDKIAMLGKYNNALDSIKKGHNDIASSSSTLKQSELKNIIIVYANQIQEIVSEFNKFKS